MTIAPLHEPKNYPIQKSAYTHCSCTRREIKQSRRNREVKPGKYPVHPNPIFREADRARNIAFARARSFGVLAISAEHGPLISHLPFVLDEAV